VSHSPRRNSLLLLAAFLPLLLLTACNHSNANMPANNSQLVTHPEPAATVVAPDTRPVIVCFGDSLTAGYMAGPGNSYPDSLQKLLDDAGYHYHVINEGVSGNTTKDGVDRLPDVLHWKPAIIIIAFGGNDGLRGLPIASTRDNLSQIVAQAKASGAHVVLGGITLPPNYGDDYIHQFDATYQLLAKQYHVPLEPFLLQNVYGVPGSMQEDGIHATAQGNVQVAKNLMPYIKPFLKK
jgi:acyl-CoA thioesterase-1